ncbi:MAG: efflux RND transporter permease subunit [Candidatus Aminicenantes bacterium]|nr:efflux RND transporter permease subunit [Candidatus Aminicenantes bacterium]
MKLPEFSVHRKVTTTMLVMILVVVGFISLSRLGLDFFPDLEFPTVSVITTYQGASSEDIEKTITKPLEQVVSSVSRVKKVTSQTSESLSVVTVEFEWGTSLDFGAQDLRDQIGLYRSFLPEEASDPLVVKFNMSMLPVVFYGIIGPMPPIELKKLIEDDVAPRLERIDGVAAAQVFATDMREILVNVDKAALESRNLSLDGILLALRAENLNLPAGNLIERYSDILVRTMGEFRTLEDIGRTMIGASATGDPIYLSDVAVIKDGLKEVRNTARIQQKNGIYLIINKRSGANTANVGRRIKAELARIQKTLPAGIEFHTAMDQSEMILEVTKNTINNAWQGGILAVLLIFLFLANWRPTLIIGLAIPLSIVTTFIVFYFAGYTLNLMTLGGLALGVGMLVDNAIVVIENMFRHRLEGKDSEQAAIVGASEVGMAITASTLTTVVVFLPLVFASGITGKLTQAMALSITFSLMSSLFVALTIVPLLASVLFRKKKGGVEWTVTGEKIWFEKVKAFYHKTLTRALVNRRWVLLGSIGAFLASLALIPFLRKEFMPVQDRDMILLKVKMPVGTALAETDRVVAMVEKIMLSEPEVKIVSAQTGSSAEENPSDQAGGMSNSGTYEGLLWVGLIPKKERKLSDVQVLEKIRGRLPKFPNVKFEAVDVSQMMMGGTTAPVSIKLFGKDLDLLKGLADSIVGRIRGVNGLRDVTHTLSTGKPEYQIRIDREKASRLGLMTGQIALAAQTATLGRVATRFREGSDEIDVRVRFQERDRSSIEAVKNIPILTPLNKIVYLDQVAVVDSREGPIQIAHENQSRIVTVTGNLAGRDINSVTRDIKKRLAGTEKSLPPGYFMEYGGQYQEMTEAFLILAGVFALAVLLVYMVMASQFESFSHPFVIMFTIPLGVIGVILALLAMGQRLNLPSIIGVIILAGVAVNNGIVMIDYINQLRRKGMGDREAIVQGAVTRLRPVLLTALTTILGMLPMMFSRSSGFEFRSPMATSLNGGLMAATFLTLFVIPIVYSYINKISFRDKNRKTA